MPRSQYGGSHMRGDRSYNREPMAQWENNNAMVRMIRDGLISSKKAFLVKCRTMMLGEMDQGKLILAVMVAKTDGEPTAMQKASQDQAKAMIRVVRTGAKLATHLHNGDRALSDEYFQKYTDAMQEHLAMLEPATGETATMFSVSTTAGLAATDLNEHAYKKACDTHMENRNAFEGVFTAWDRLQAWN